MACTKCAIQRSCLVDDIQLLLLWAVHIPIVDCVLIGSGVECVHCTLPLQLQSPLVLPLLSGLLPGLSAGVSRLSIDWFLSVTVLLSLETHTHWQHSEAYCLQYSPPLPVPYIFWWSVSVRGVPCTVWSQQHTVQ